MQVKVRYIAKNGVEFDDPYQCEQYEKLLDCEPGTTGYLLKNLEQFDDEDLFDGTLCFKKKGCGAQYYSRTNIDFSDLYEGEFVTQAMKEAQERATTKVKDVRTFFGGFTPETACGGFYSVFKKNTQKCTICRMNCDKVFEAIDEENTK